MQPQTNHIFGSLDWKLPLQVTCAQVARVLICCSLCSTLRAADIVGGELDIDKAETGSAAGDKFGQSVCGPGDLNGDEVPDYVVGAPYHNWFGSDSGQVTAYSGSDHTILWQLGGESNTDYFGLSMTAIADVDGDGVKEIAVSAPNHQNGSHPFAGKVYLFSGQTGSEIWTYGSIYDFQFFGTVLAAVGDVDGDGYEDIAAGMPNASKSDTDALVDEGRIVVLTGRFGQFVQEVYGSKSNNQFGFSIASPGDLNTDGFADLVVGVPGYSTASSSGVGRLTLLNGKSLAGHSSDLYLQIITGTHTQAHLGYCVAATGDLNGDDVGDFVASEPYANTSYGNKAGIARVYSGSDRTTIYELFGESANEQFGTALAGGGDIDHDDIPDVIIGAKDRGAGVDGYDGAVLAYAGRTGELELDMSGNGTEYAMGESLACIGDLDDDGTDEILVGSPAADFNDTNDGMIHIVSIVPYLNISRLRASRLLDHLVLSLDFGGAHALEAYKVVISRSGTGPVPFTGGGVLVPLTRDPWANATWAGVYPGFASGFAGTLDSAGHSHALIDTSLYHPAFGTYYFAAVTLSASVITSSSIVQIVEFY